MIEGRCSIEITQIHVRRLLRMYSIRDIPQCDVKIEVAGWIIHDPQVQ